MDKYEKLLKEIYYTEDLINFLPMLFVACIEDKSKSTTYNVDNSKAKPPATPGRIEKAMQRHFGDVVS